MKLFTAFSGIGAPEKALGNLGVYYELVGYSENDPNPAKAYSLIHNVNEKFNYGDITKINWNEIDDIDLFWYSPPCQAFSRQGKELGMDDERGVLFFDALRGIKIKQPKVAIMENVKGLVGKKFKHEFDVMLQELENAGYKNYWKVLNALDYNVAQTRERVFIVSIRNDKSFEYQFPHKNKLNKSLNDYIEEDAEPIFLHNIYGGFKESNARVFDKYSPTIRTSAGGGHLPSVVLKDNSSTEGKLFYVEDEKYYLEKDEVDPGKTYIRARQITPREAFRLQGFTDNDFDKIHNEYKNTILYRMAGNSIPIPMLEELLKPLFKK